jgi:hypothetical protein
MSGGAWADTDSHVFTRFHTFSHVFTWFHMVSHGFTPLFKKITKTEGRSQKVRTGLPCRRPALRRRHFGASSATSNSHRFPSIPKVFGFFYFGRGRTGRAGGGLKLTAKSLQTNMIQVNPTKSDFNFMNRNFSYLERGDGGRAMANAPGTGVGRTKPFGTWRETGDKGWWWHEWPDFTGDCRVLDQSETQGRGQENYRTKPFVFVAQWRDKAGLTLRSRRIGTMAGDEFLVCSLTYCIGWMDYWIAGLLDGAGQIRLKSGDGRSRLRA